MGRIKPVPQGVTQSFGVPNSAYRLGYHPGTDYGCPSGTTVVAPEGGRLHWIGNLGDGYGNQAKLYLDSGGVLVFCHLQNLPAGCKVAQDQHVWAGQQILTSGNTGWVQGDHLHVEHRPTDDINKPANFEIWLNTGGGNEMFNNLQEVEEAYIQMRGVPGTQAEMQPWVGQSKQRWIQLSTLETNSTRQQLSDVRSALKNLQDQPPKVVIKEVEKIVNVPVEVIKEVPVGEEEAIRGFFGRLLDLLIGLVRIK